MAGLDPRTGRPVGDHGSYADAVNFLLENDQAPGEETLFLQAWTDGRAFEEWPEFYDWLKDYEQKEKVWIVEGEVGEYSDRSTWVVGAWRDEQTAKAFVEEIDALGREAFKVYGQRYSEKKTEWDQKAKACEALDPEWGCDYCGPATYTAYEVSVR